MSLLTLTDVHSYYDHIYLKGISLTVEQGEIISLIGSNGAGKSTTLRTVSGMEPYTIGLSGLGYVFKGHGIPPRLTVRGNLEMRAFTVRDSVAVRQWMEYGCELFPRLQERLNQYDGTLSGGEQQMLAIAQGLMMPPRRCSCSTNHRWEGWLRCWWSWFSMLPRCSMTRVSPFSWLNKTV